MKPKEKDRYWLESGSRTKITESVKDFADTIESSSDIEFMVKAMVNARKDLEKVYSGSMSKRSVDQILMEGTSKGCGDYAHVMAALARSQGIPARIITGIEDVAMESIKNMSQGRPATTNHIYGSHIVAECKTEEGWMLFDPSRNRIDPYEGSDRERFQERYYTIDTVRDYGDKGLTSPENSRDHLRNFVVKKFGLEEEFDELNNGEKWIKNGERTEITEGMETYVEEFADLEDLEFIYKTLKKIRSDFEETAKEIEEERSVEEIFERKNLAGSDLPRLMASLCRNRDIPARITRGIPEEKLDSVKVYHKDLKESTTVEFEVDGDWLHLNQDYSGISLGSDIFTTFRWDLDMVTSSIDSWEQGIRSKEDLKNHYQRKIGGRE